MKKPLSIGVILVRGIGILFRLVWLYIYTYIIDGFHWLRKPIHFQGNPSILSLSRIMKAKVVPKKALTQNASGLGNATSKRIHVVRLPAAQ